MTKRWLIALAILVAFVVAPMHHHLAPPGGSVEAAAARTCGVCLLHGKVAVRVAPIVQFALNQTSFLVAASPVAPLVESHVSPAISRGPPSA